MAVGLYYPPSTNALQKQLNADYTASDAVITLTNTTNIQNKPGVCVINRINTASERQAAADWTYIKFTGTSGSTLTGCTAISGDQDHAIGEVVEFIFDVTQGQAIVDTFDVDHDVDTGTHKLTQLLDTNGNETIKTPATTSAVNEVTVTNAATGNAPELSATGGDTNIDLKLKGKGTGHAQAYSEYDAAYFDLVPNHSMSRQAIMNGNFDVWQRGTPSSTITDATIFYTADRWYDYHADDGGTLPTLTRSRQALTPGDIPNAFYYSRLATNGAGTSLGVSSIGTLTQRIEYGTRSLCGNGKKVTISFWAKSDISNKKIGIYAHQTYGTGGSPTSSETINGTNWTLTSNWTKYTHTFTTNTLVGKTFGTNYDDYFGIYITYMWGTTTDERVGATTAETYVGSGNIDVAQVQLCTGEVALPFQPKSFEEELRACQRYFQAFNAGDGMGVCYSTTGVALYFPYATTMRSTPQSAYPGVLTNALNVLSIGAKTPTAISDQSITPASLMCLATGTSGLTIGLPVYIGIAGITVSSEL